MEKQLPRRISGIHAAAVALFVAITHAPPAHALDPIVLYLLRSLRDKAVTASVEALLERQEAALTAPRPLPDPGRITDGELQRLIETSFVHLSPAQRQEVYASLQRILADPANATDRPDLVAQLRAQAAASRQMHDMLGNLTYEQKRRIAREAGQAYELLSPSERGEMVGVLQTLALPLPGDLHAMIMAELAAIDRRPAR